MVPSIFRFEHFCVRPDRIVVTLYVTDERFAYTNSNLIDALVQEFPQLLNHACVNNRGPVFGSVAYETSMPHLLEHVVIALQALREPSQCQGKTYLGKTYWLDRDCLHACVEVNYADDLIGLRAFRDAATLIDSIVLK